MRKNNIRYFIIIGSSRGLGAALVEELMKEKSYYVIGLARTKLENIRKNSEWINSERYHYIELDITSENCQETLISISSELSQEPVCVVFNAACIKSDVKKNQCIDYDIFLEINNVGICGLGNVLKAFEKHLLTYGGTFVGISSFSALRPAVIESKVAYCASKAYLEMALRCLRVIWDKKVKVVIIRLGHIGIVTKLNLHKQLVPVYSKAAKKIVRELSKEKISEEINYPIFYSIVYKCILNLLSDNLYCRLIKLFSRYSAYQKSNKI